ncbi:MAG: TonB-dependent receptor, partial [Vicinamibacteraceae bacterium]
SVELGCDYVRGEIQSGNEPLPRIPPRRARVALRYRVGAFQAGGEVTSLGAQERVFGPETPTKGAALVRLFTAHSIIAGGAVHTVSARVDNATNHFYRNHLSFLKDIVPEMGRSLRVTYAVHF